MMEVQEQRSEHQSKTVSGGGTRTRRTETKKVVLSGADTEELITSSVTKSSYSSRSQHQRHTQYEVDDSKHVPKLILINRTEPVRFESVNKGEGGASTETTVNLNFKSKKSSGANLNLRDGFDKVASTWETDRTSLHNLNERLGSFIETVRSLESENKNLVDQLASLKGNWVNETMKVKEEDAPQLQRYRKDLENAEFEKARIEVQLSSIEDRFNELQVVFDEAQLQNLLDIEEIANLRELILEYESELSLLRKRVLAFDSEKNKDIEEIARIKKSIATLRTRLDEETENHIIAEHRAQTRREEIEFMKAIQEAELKELQGLIYKESSSESKGFWRNELAQALEEISSEYEKRVDDVKFELEMEYEKKSVEQNAASEEVQVSAKSSEELAKAREESAAMKLKCKDLELQLPELQEKQRQSALLLSDLRRQLEELQRSHDVDRGLLFRQLNESQGELDHIMKELQTLLDSKLSLDLQIAAYRKLIEGEESRTVRSSSGGAASAASLSLFTSGGEATSVSAEADGGEVIVASSAVTAKSSKSSASAKTVAVAESVEKSSTEISTKTSFKKSVKGVVSIKEAAIDGRFVKLEYKGKAQKRESIEGWKLRRQVEGSSIAVEYVFPEGTIIEPEGQHKSLTIWARGLRPEGNDHDHELPTEQNWGMGANVSTLLLDKNGDEKAKNIQVTTTTGSAA